MTQFHYMPYQGKSIGMASTGFQAQYHVSRFDPVGSDYAVLFHYAHRKPCQVIFSDTVDIRHLRGFTADQCASCFPASPGYSRHHRLGLVQFQFGGGEVVQEIQRLCAANHDIVYTHGDKVDAYGIVPVHALGDFQLGPDAVRAGHQDRVAEAHAGRVEEATEQPDVAEHARREGRADGVAREAERRVLGYEDGICEVVPEALGARRIGVLLDELRPDLVLSCGQDGVTGHPDHRAVAQWTYLAVSQRAPGTPLLATAAGAAWPSDIVEGMHRVGAFWPGYPERAPDGPVWEVRLQGAPLSQKLRALSCHRSQIAPLLNELGAADYRRLASYEAYRPQNFAAARILSGTPQVLPA